MRPSKTQPGTVNAASADSETGPETNVDAGTMKDTARGMRWLLRGLFGVAALLVLGVALLNTPIGKRLVANQIAAAAPASGLRFEVGTIEGNLFGDAILHDVTAFDPQGEFLKIPEVELRWRPLSWVMSGLDLRVLAARRGTLLRLPELLPGDPDAPILPDFDITIGQFAVEDLTLAAGVAGPDAQHANLLVEADIQSGRVYLKAEGQLGENDTVFVLIDAQPDDDIFDFAVEYQAPQGGVLATLFGAGGSYTAKAVGEGTWTAWDGAIAVQRDDARLAAFTLTNRGGQYHLLGQAGVSDLFSGVPAKALGDTISVAVKGRLEESVVSGSFDLIGQSVRARGDGAIDLAGNAFDNFGVNAALTDPQLLGEGLTLYDTAIELTVDGPFRNLTIGHRLRVGELQSGTAIIRAINQQSTGRFDGTRWSIPLDVSVDQLVTGHERIDSKLVGGKLGGMLVYTNGKLLSDNLAIGFAAANARLALRGDISTGTYVFTGPITATEVRIDGIGVANGTAKIDLRIDHNNPWTLHADFDARVPAVVNDTVAHLAGSSLQFLGEASFGGAVPLDFQNVSLVSEILSLSLKGTLRPDGTIITGQGTQKKYGDFTIEAAVNEAGPSAVVMFANPFPAAGLHNVRVAAAPSQGGFAIDTEGQSMLGAFKGALHFVAPQSGPSRVNIVRLNIWKTAVTGALTLDTAGANGRLVLSGGGLDGRIGLVSRSGGQAFAVDIDADAARFGGDIPLSLARANVEARGYIKGGTSTVEGSLLGQGFSYGGLFLGRIAAQAKVENGRGNATASVAGRRGSRFNLQFNSTFAPKRIAVAARGDFAGKIIRMPNRAVLQRQSGGSWSLAPTQLSYGGGALIASGQFGGEMIRADLQLDKVPLSLVDLAIADIGLDGTISGLVDFAKVGNLAATGSAQVKVDNLTRSGLVLTSQPIDLSLVTRLSANRLEARTVVEEDGQRRGRLQARITGLPISGNLIRRLERGDLFAQLRFDGPAASIWRLLGIEGFDLTGPLKTAANVTGSLADPIVRGSVRSNSLRLQSSLSGTNVQDIVVRGTFSGSELRLSRFAGKTSNGGTVSGSGTVGFRDLGIKGPQINLRIAAKNANLVNAAGLDATVTGPLRIVSNGLGGTVAGRLIVNRASWNLGSAVVAEQLPQISTQEINTPADIAPVRAITRPWRYLIDAQAANKIDVDGLGLNSEWGANIRLRGTTSDPRIGGEARVVSGYYTFAGARFQLERGRINFDQDGPIDPRLDIRAETKTNKTDVIVSVKGSAQRPEIIFTSDPVLAEEEILAQLLFGGSITKLSATDALQLGTALASLRGGGGLDPINELRSAVGLDRLRIVSADPALGRQTGVALGKNIGRAFYIEIITDGRGYNATQAEFRVTSWLSLLGSISTIARESVVAKISRDY